MEEKYLSPCRTDLICKGCTLKRSCATKLGIPNCLKQFMDGLEIKSSIINGQKELAQLQKENDELRTALVLFTEYAEVYGDQPFYEIPRVKMMIAKEVIDKKGDDAG